MPFAADLTFADEERGPGENFQNLRGVGAELVDDAEDEPVTGAAGEAADVDFASFSLSSVAMIDCKVNAARRARTDSATSILARENGVILRESDSILLNKSIIPPATSLFIV